MESAHIVVALTDDLIFGSRIAGVGRDHGATVRTARTVEAMSVLAKETGAACVMIDLALAGPRIAEMVSSLRALPASPRIVAYGSHVDAMGLRRAADAGCDVVLPRSRFVEALETDFSQWLAARSESP